MSRLQSQLIEVERSYHRKALLPSDPLEFVHRFSDPWDQEAVALVSALLAYGNVKQIRGSVERVLARIAGTGLSPSQFVRSLSKPRFQAKAATALDGWVHRFNQGPDLVVLFSLLEKSWRGHGSLGAHFVSHLQPADPHIGPALGKLIRDWRAWAAEGQVPKPRASFHYLLTSPEEGSCCKRWCMLLRWMGRKDELDPGLWNSDGALAAGFPAGRALRPGQLIIPLDTHTGRISQSWGLTERKSLNWKAAIEVTERLRRFAPEDPVRFDFALARLGMFKGRVPETVS